ncbi:MAG TPA: (2Fe-2S)-binding protein [Prolixibacteraceae bacterium]|jgi:NAD(P)H-nitrite reductase large subunit
MKTVDFHHLKTIDPGKMICYCNHVTQGQIEEAMKQGAKTLSDIQKITGACTGNQCKELNPSGKCCSGDIHRLLKNEGLVYIKPSGCS